MQNDTHGNENTLRCPAYQKCILGTRSALKIEHTLQKKNILHLKMSHMSVDLIFCLRPKCGRRGGLVDFEISLDLKI